MEDQEGEEPRKSFVSILAWVKRGVAKETPEIGELTSDQIQNFLNEKCGKDDKPEEDEKETEVKDVAMEGNEMDEIDAKYDLQDYDNEDQNDAVATLANLICQADITDDPYIQNASEDEEEAEDFKIKQNDNLLVVGHVEDDWSSFEVHVVNEADGDNYVHHDIILPSYPMAFEWLNYAPSAQTPGNYLAIGGTTPVITVWDLDLVNSLKPAYQLGKKANKKKKTKAIGHKDFVLSLSWNKSWTNVLASGSADKSIIIWDLAERAVNTTIKDFKDSVNSLEFNPKEASYLIAGSKDTYVRLYDCRNSDAHNKAWKINGEVEIVRWNAANPCFFTLGTKEGLIETYDIRNQQPLHSFKAHSEEISGIAFSPKIPSCMSTISDDGFCKIWNLADGPEPKLVFEREMNMGPVFTNEFCPDAALLLATGGHKTENNLEVWDLSKKDHVVATFYNPSNSQRLLEIYGQFNQSNFNSDLIFGPSNLPSTSKAI